MTHGPPRVIAWVPGARSIPQAVARIPATVHTKLMVAFLGIVLLFVAVGAVGLQVLKGSKDRAEELVDLQRKVAAYRQLQHNTTEQLYAVTSALLTTDQRTLDATFRQLGHFAYDFDRAQFVGDAEADLLERIESDYDALIEVSRRVVQLVRNGDRERGRTLQLGRAVPLAERIERHAFSLVNRAQAEMIEQAQAGNTAYVTSQRVVIGVALASIILALVLGYAISWSLIGPVQQMDAQFRNIGRGEFGGRLDVPNRDELGDLAEKLNQTSAELDRLYREIQAASQHKSEFLANMSHELRTPLNAIIGFSEVLSERMFGELNDKQVEYVQDIHESGQHLLSLINDILDLSKIEAGRMEVELGEFDVRLALDNALTLVKERAGRHGITLETDIDEKMGEISADERKFKQILLNLLSNAIKFTPEGGCVRLEAVRDSEMVEIRISDTGIGIAEEDQRAIFEEFRQAARQGATSEGTGLGLTLTKKFVEMQGGRIWVKSKVGEGSTFGFSLPTRPTVARVEAV